MAMHDSLCRPRDFLSEIELALARDWNGRCADTNPLTLHHGPSSWPTQADRREPSTRHIITLTTRIERNKMKEEGRQYGMEPWNIEKLALHLFACSQNSFSVGIASIQEVFHGTFHGRKNDWIPQEVFDNVRVV